MAKSKNKKSKSGIPLDVESKIIRMGPADLAVECTFERNAIDTLKEQSKDDSKIQELKETVDQFNKELSQKEQVQKAKDAYEAAKEEYMSEDHVEAKADLAALRKGYTEDIKNRSKKLKFMEKTLKNHIESGALKRVK